MEHNPKQQVVERLKSSTNILVTVSSNPSVDQLAACIGFTLMLNKLGKHATAVFSGAVPSTLEFLQPEKTIEKNTDSLQDFIIALDKSKADKLRYKVEDDVVRIFITPYRTSISDKDLEFSLGDFNVDVVLALGITRKEDIDQAIVAHGRILHDATVMALTAGEATSDVGSINWHEQTASSLSEMLVSISESFQSGLLDPQMATSFLTGIVAETERFSNEKTSPKVMTMSAQLMAAGANQQLIASKLEPEVEPEPEPVTPFEPPVKEQPAPDPASEPPKVDGEIDIPHSDEVIAQPEPETEPEDEGEIHIDDEGNLKLEAEKRAEEKARQAAEANTAAELAAAATEAPDEFLKDDGYIASGTHKVIDPLPGQGLYDPLLPTPPAGSALDLPTIASPMPASEPVSSAIPPLESLAQLEVAVGSPHVDALPPAVDDARQAVATARIDIPPPPQASQSLGATHVDLDSLLPPVPVDSSLPPITESAAPVLAAPQPGLMPAFAPVQEQAVPVVQSSDPLAPPPVPPPMTAPFFEPKTSHHNPYLNPSETKPAEDPNDTAM